ncbi:glutamate receptor subunit protein glur5, partial [Plakobranchus ocellatus]
MYKSVGGTVDSESALRSAGTLLSRVRTLQPAPSFEGGPENLISPCCRLTIYKNPNSFGASHLFSQSESPAPRTALMYAISRHNEEQERKKLGGEVFNLLSEPVDTQSNFNVTLKMCDLMKSGIFVIYGSISHQSYTTSQAYSHKFHIPFITPNLV